MTEAELIKRLEHLERDNRRLTRFAIAALAMASVLGTIYATRPTPAVIRAHELDVVDSAGKARITMDVDQGMPTILLSDIQGTPHMGMYVNKSGWPIVWLTGAMVRYNVPSSIGALATMQSSIRLYVDPASGEPTISLSDPQDFEMDLGSTRTVTSATGATKQSSAASIVMFTNDKEHHVIWHAP